MARMSHAPLEDENRSDAETTRPDVVGIVGIGSMGTPVAQHLLTARGTLVVHARSPRPELVAAGEARDDVIAVTAAMLRPFIPTGCIWMPMSWSNPT